MIKLFLIILLFCGCTNRVYPHDIELADEICTSSGGVSYILVGVSTATAVCKNHTQLIFYKSSKKAKQ